MDDEAVHSRGHRMLGQSFDKVTTLFKRYWWLSYLVGYSIVMTIPAYIVMRAALQYQSLGIGSILSLWLKNLSFIGVCESIPWVVLLLREVISKAGVGVTLNFLFAIASIFAYFLQTDWPSTAVFGVVIIQQLIVAVFIILASCLYRVLNRR